MGVVAAKWREAAPEAGNFITRRGVTMGEGISLPRFSSLSGCLNSH